MKDDKTTLQDQFLEMTLLGALMLEPKSNDSKRIFKIISTLNNIFSDERNQKIYNAIWILNDSNEDIDLISVTHQLRKTSDLEFCQPMHVVDCYNLQHDVRNSIRNIFILSELYFRRSIFKLGQVLSKRVFEYNIDIFEIIKDAENQLKAATEIIEKARKL